MVVQAVRSRVERLGGFAYRWGTTIGRYSHIRLRRSWNCLKVEMAPPTAADLPEMAATANKIMKSAVTFNFLNLTFREVTLNLIVVLDIIFCFFLGEIIGRWNLIGYYLPPRYFRTVGVGELIG